jgi:uncharacterized membrane protein YkvA (DUF1232 family)
MEAEEINRNTSTESDYIKEYYPDGEMSETEIDDLVTKVDEKASENKGVRSFIRHLKALGNYLFDTDVKWYRRAVVAAALIYFLTPLDSIPDFVPFAGFLDDLGVITWTVRFLGNEIKRYY